MNVVKRDVIVVKRDVNVALADLMLSGDRKMN